MIYILNKCINPYLCILHNLKRSYLILSYILREKNCMALATNNTNIFEGERGYLGKIFWPDKTLKFFPKED